jgi:5-methyltetrahydrofolate--homocysteine methyltransferase
MVIIGEKINGAIPAVAQAIRNRDAPFIQNLARAQADAGADYLDLCAGTSPDVEGETLEWLVSLVEDTVDLPLCIDSPNPEVLSAIVPRVKREGIINSVSGEGSKADILYPLAAKTGWKLIVLACDDGGVSADAAQKAEIASSLIVKAGEHGIGEDRLYVDPLVMAVSAVSNALPAFIDAIKLIREKHGGTHFTSGLSNISYGTPARKNINRGFLFYAIEAGMDSAIMDPTNRDLYAAILTAELLLGRDKHSRNYNKAWRAGRL